MSALHLPPAPADAGAGVWLELLLRLSADPVLVLRPADESVIAAGDAACALYGFPPGGMEGARMADLSRDPDYGRMRVRRTLAADGAHRFRSVHLRRDGAHLAVEVEARRMTLDGEEVIVAVHRPLDAPADGGGETAQAEVRPCADAEDADADVLVGAGGTIRRPGAALGRVLGVPAEEQAGRSLLERVHTGDAARLLAALARSAAGGGPETLSCRMRHERGGWRVVETALSPSSSGGDGAIRLTLRDSTERRRTEEERRRLSALLDASPDLVWIGDPGGRVLYMNRAARERTGRSPGEAEGLHLPDLHPDHAERLLAREAVPGAAEAGTWTGETAMLGAGGEEIPVSAAVVAHRDADGELSFLSCVARDITDAKRVEAALRESEERFRQLAENVDEVFWLLDRDTGRLLYVSPAVERVWGLPAERVLAEPRLLLDAVAGPGADGPDATDRLLGTDREHSLIHADGSIRWVRSRAFAVRDERDRVYRVAGISQDVTERRRDQEQLIRIALYDSLTGLPNRAALMKRLTRSMERAEHRPERAFTVLFVDLDRFKVINDSLGHATGDALLVCIARTLEGCVRPGDMVARLAGDEFVVVLSDTVDPADAARVAERILARLGERFTLGSHEVYTGASIGVVPSSGYRSPDDLLRDADIAMYRAKTSGGARYQLFDGAMHASAVRRLALETDLRRALEAGEFSLHYQPVVETESGRTAGFEALLRWRHPERGPVPPAEFVRVAEETGLIVPLGQWVLREACRQMREWTGRVPGAEALTVSVNLSARQFAARDLVRAVEDVLEETGIAPERLRLELTESALADRAGPVAGVLERLRALGIRILVDDFGTGYSSLSYLDRLPIDCLKVDRSFVSRIGPDGGGGEIVRTVAALGHNLGLELVAEGVETEVQLEQVRALRCRFAQGFLFSRPLSASQAEAWLLREAAA